MVPCFFCADEKVSREGPGYEHDERARPGPIRDRRRWRKQGANRTAAVESPKERASEDARGLSGTAKGAKR